jgi:hypothetical protein
MLQVKGGGFPHCYGNEQIVEMLKISDFLNTAKYLSPLEEAVNAIAD